MEFSVLASREVGSHHHHVLCHELLCCELGLDILGFALVKKIQPQARVLLLTFSSACHDLGCVGTISLTSTRHVLVLCWSSLFLPLT